MMQSPDQKFYELTFPIRQNGIEWGQISPNPPLLAFPFGFPLKVFKTCLLGRDFHTFINNVSFPSPTDVRSHNPPPSRSNVLACTHSPLQLI